MQFYNSSYPINYDITLCYTTLYYIVLSVLCYSTIVIIYYIYHILYYTLLYSTILYYVLLASEWWCFTPRSPGLGIVTYIDGVDIDP